MRLLLLTAFMRGLAVAVVSLGVLADISTHAAVVTLSFTGTYNVVAPSGVKIFGLSGPTVPFSYELTYDTSLNTSTQFFPAGASLGGYTTTSEWHGYSTSGVTATSLTLGSQTWTVANLIAMIPAIGVSADLWFDTDIGLATPTLTWFFLSVSGARGPNYLQIGGGASDARNIFLQSARSLVNDGNSGVGAISSNMNIQAVPEPATFSLLALGGLGIMAARRRRA